MTWANRGRLALGLVIVLALVFCGVVIFNQRQNTVQSRTATIVSQEFSVGTDYGGVVTSQFVREGDEVRAGDPLLVVTSALVQRDLATGVIVDPRAATDGAVTISAAVDGEISDLADIEGSFVQSGSVLASIAKDGSLSVNADFVLSPRDYARIEAGTSADIELPDGHVLAGEVTAIDVATVDGAASTIVHVSSPTLADASASGLYQPGTPVDVRLHLRDDGVLAGAQDAVRDLLRKIGL